MIAPGVHLGPYEIVSRIGAGGMGEVWRARDTRLDRDVAVKILLDEFARDSDRLRRFEQESRAAGALNHPNLVTIHDIGSSDDTVFIVMELLEGETLRGKLSDSLQSPDRIPIRKAVDYATQIANGLAVAHDKGIIHRDLKPENVFVTNDGRVKILDFGLAKLRAGGDDGSTEARTQQRDTSPGTVLGTAGYMSPEQVRGHEVDHRSDIFAYGAILYEMLSGKRAFRGQSAADTMSAILKEDPPDLSGDGLQVSPALDRIVHRCMEKSRDERFHSAHDIAFALEAISGTSTSASGVVAVPERPQILRRLMVATVILGLVALAFLAGRRTAGMAQSASRATTASLKQLTFLDGEETLPSISPDGNSFVYVARGAAGNRDIFLQRVGGENPVNLTSESADDDEFPSFSPDGQQIAFSIARGPGRGLYVMGATGESRRKLASFGFNASWSPDSKEVVVGTEPIYVPTGRENAGELWRVNVATGERLRIDTKGGDAVQPSWSPSGKRVAYWGLPAGTGKRVLYTISIDGGEPVRLTDDDWFNWNPAWSSDGRYLFFASSRGGTMNLWRMPIDEESGKAAGAPEPVTTAAQWNGQFSIGKNGSIVYVAGQLASSLERLPFDRAAAKLAVPSVILSGSREIWNLQPSPDGAWIVFKAYDTQEDLLVARADGTGVRRLTNDRFKDRDPQWGPDSETIYFFSDRSGRYDLWSIHRDGSTLQQVTRSTGNTVSNPYPSPDGKHLATGYYDTRIIDLTKPIEQRVGGPLPSIGTDTSFIPGPWSPDGSRLLGTAGNASGTTPVPGLWTVDLQTKTYDKVAERGVPIGWLPDSKSIIAFDGPKLFLVDLASKRQQEISGFPRGFRALTVSADGRFLYGVRLEFQGDVWMMRHEAPEKEN